MTPAVRTSARTSQACSRACVLAVAAAARGPRGVGPRRGAEAESRGQPRDDDPQIPQGDAQVADSTVMPGLVHGLGPAEGAGTGGIPRKARVAGQVHVV